MSVPCSRPSLDYFERMLGVSFDRLLGPIPGMAPCGESLRGTAVYRAIQDARKEEDASLPLGPWVRELKRADWARTADLACAALAHKSKDLQIAAWLLEAQIHRDGFNAIAPCTSLIRVLCERYWEGMHPLPREADLEYRTNIIHWLDQKLLPVLRLVPLTQALRQEKALTWADWEQARRNERQRATRGADEPVEGVTLAEFSAAMASCATEWHCELHQQLESGAASIDALAACLNSLCGAESPSLRHMRGLLEQIQMFVDSEMHKRGVVIRNEPQQAPSPAEPAPAPPAARPPGPPMGRDQAYTRLAELAEYLQHLEPHSPVPYLLRRAVIWGSLNTAELYHEMFVKCAGRLDIFEVLGVSIPQQPQE